MRQRPAVTSYIRSIVIAVAGSLLGVPQSFAQGQIAPGGPGSGGGFGGGRDEVCTDLYVYACCNGHKEDASNSCQWRDMQEEGCTARGRPENDCSGDGSGSSGGSSGGSAGGSTGGCSLCGDVCCYNGQLDNGHNCALTGGDCSGGMLVGGKCPGSYCAPINGAGGGSSGSGQSKPPSGGSSSPQPPGSCTGVACLESGGAGGSSFGSGGYILKNFNFSGSGSALAAASSAMKIPPPSNPRSPAGWYSVASSGFINGIAQFGNFGGVKASAVKALGNQYPFSQVNLPKRSKASPQAFAIATSNGSLYPSIFVFTDSNTVAGVVSSGSRASRLASGPKKALKGLIDTSSKKGKVDQAFAMALPKGIGAAQALLSISDPGYRIVSMRRDPSSRAFKVASMSDTLSPQRVWGALGVSLPADVADQLLQVLFVGGSDDLPKSKKKTKKK